MLSLDYIAGLLDADGSFAISVSKARYVRKDGTESNRQISFVVNFRQAAQYRSILEEIQETLGVGKIYDHKGGGSAPMLTWQTTKESETLAACQILLPYLHIKSEYCAMLIEALELWDANKGKPWGSGYLRPESVKQQVLEISSRMNPSQQKETSRRNKEIRIDKDSFGPNSKVYEVPYPEEWADITFSVKE